MELLAREAESGPEHAGSEQRRLRGPAASTSAPRRVGLQKMASTGDRLRKWMRQSLRPAHDGGSVGLQAAGHELLLVDEDPVVHTIVRRYLTDRGLAMVSADSEASALKLLAQRWQQGGDARAFPSIIVLGLQMPGCNGLDVVRRFRALYPAAETPVIAYTSDDCSQTLPELLEAGFSDYATKSSGMGCADLLSRVCVQLNLVQTYKRVTRLERADRLLKDILPSNVVKQLVDGNNVQPQQLGEVSVLFSDIVGFTTLAAQMPTTDLISLLNDLFSAFDLLVMQHDVFKVETIGDSYMCVAGYDEKTRNDHAQRMVRLGLAFIQAASTIRLPNGKPLQIRVGINTGHAYGGVVGAVRPRYCLFGDTVNVASRMESSGVPGHVHISESVFTLCKSRDVAGFIAQDLAFEPLGPQQIKGKGEMCTWLVHTIVPTVRTAPGCLAPLRKESGIDKPCGCCSFNGHQQHNRFILAD